VTKGKGFETKGLIHLKGSAEPKAEEGEDNFKGKGGVMRSRSWGVGFIGTLIGGKGDT